MDAIDHEILTTLAGHLKSGTYEEFVAQGKGCGWCRHPVRLRGVVTATADDERHVQFSTGTLPDGVFLKACGTRRETRCPSCASVYRADARHLIRAGLIGGKGVDESITTHPAVLLTLTAPSFGVVHAAKTGAPCRPGHSPTRCPHGRRTVCFVRHHSSDDIVSTPLCPGCYDYVGAVLHNASTPELWRRTTIYIQRQLAVVLGRTQAQTNELVRLSFCRVAEYQRRGIVHLHAVIRADGYGGALPPVTEDQLVLACVRAARAVRVPHVRGVALWGSELDVQVLERVGNRAQRIAGYTAKYATKSSDDSGALDRPVTSDEDLAHRVLSPHLRRMVETAWQLGADPKLSDLHLRRYAHTLGYSGHFLTKSLQYSSTFASLRAERATWREARRGRGVAPPGQTVDAEWQVVGSGWANRGEALFAEDKRRQRLDEHRAANEDRYWV